MVWVAGFIRFAHPSGCLSALRPPLPFGRLPFFVSSVPIHTIKKAPMNGTFLMVGVAGFEPTTTCPPDKCATRLRYTPMNRHYIQIFLKDKTFFTRRPSFCQNHPKTAE